MGILRTLLALSVVAGHCGAILGLRSVGGVISVQTFYMISGFYMALILSDKYQAGWAGYRVFIVNRLLRLLPIYWIVLGITVLFSVLGHFYFSHDHVLNTYIQYGPRMSPFTALYFVFTNLFAFLQDTVLFFKLDLSSGKLAFTSDFRAFDPQLFSFMFLPQAWTLGVEMTFYLVAPFLMRLRLRWVVLIIALSLLSRVAAYRTGLNHDPWTYRFFPFELAFFLIGRLSFEIYQQIKALPLRRDILTGLLFAVLAWTLFYDWISLPAMKYAYFGCLAVAIPFLFHLTRDSKVDRWIGELSYPVYISHASVSAVLVAIVSPKLLTTGNPIGVVTLVVSILLARFVGAPIEAIRLRRRASALSPSPKTKFDLIDSRVEG